MPSNLKSGLDLLNKSFSSTHMRSLDILYNSEGGKLYGLMTNYEGKNFCWIQPTRVKTRKADAEYNKYVRRLNDKSEKALLWEIRIGMDCIAKYEADSHWYRGIVVGEEPENKWLVLFIDYGNFQCCDSSQISAPILESQFNHYYAPVQSLCCRLYNIVPTNPAFQNEIDVRLETFFTKHISTFLEIEVRNIRPDFVIDCDVFLLEEEEQEEEVEESKNLNRRYRKHIGQELVDAGLASFADPLKAHAIKIPKAELVCR